jgi:TonB-linked SusC/RagA family outer membrane protein
MTRKFLTIIMLFFATTAMSVAQNVSGTVTDDNGDGDGLAGVSVLEKGTTNGAVTDLDGKFRIELKSSPATLVFSMIGMVSQEKQVKSGDNINIVLSEDTKMLEQVVVTGYTTQRKADLTGAVAVVDVADMMTAAENNPIKALQGRVAGMTVSADGNPSGAATVRIRGIGTLNNNDPLYIIDGVPTKGGMHELNSNDIESIQVLKDASSASIYGSRAANGVIIITTKKGKSGSLKVNFDAYITATNYANRLSVMNTEQYGQALWQAAINSYADPNNNNIAYRFDTGYDDNGNPVLNNMYLPKYVDEAQTMRTANTDWYDEVSRTGLLQSYNLSVSNGSEKGHSFFSLGYFHNDGTLKYTNFNRYSLRANSDYSLWDGRLAIGENISLNNTAEVSGNVLDPALKMLPMVPVHTTDGEGWGGPSNGMNDRHNPVRSLYYNKDNGYRFIRGLANAFADLEIIKDLHLRTNFGVDYQGYYQRSLEKTYVSGFLHNERTGVSMNQTHTINWNWANTLTYAKTIDKNVFDGLAGVEMFRNRYVGFTGRTSGEGAFAVESAEYMYPDVSAGKAELTGNGTGYSLLSYFGKANYAYDNRYLLSATVRYDGSSRFGKNNRFGTFPAFSAGWRISEEAFMESTRNIFSDLKLRVAWGQTGNQEIDNFATYTIYVPNYGLGDPTWDTVWGTAYDITGKGGGGTLPSGYQKIQSGNPNLRWETTTQTNFGIDFALLNNKLYGSAEYYIKDTKDILLNPAYLAAKGEGGYMWQNGASLQNRGYEILLGYRNKTASGLSYDITGNISAFRNKVTHLPEEVENSYGGRAGDNILGHPLGAYYGYVADGLFTTQDEVDNHAAQQGKAPGRIRYRDIYGKNADGSIDYSGTDGTVDDADQTWLGNPYPDFTYGWNIALEYRGFDLNLFLQGVQGIDVNVFDVKVQTDFWSLHDANSNKGTRLLDAWSATNTSSSIPALQQVPTNDEGRFSTYFLESGSYMKLRNIQLGYTLPGTLTQKAKIEKLRFYVSGQNLFTLKSKSFTGVDPENSGFGYPIPVTATFGLNLTF